LSAGFCAVGIVLQTNPPRRARSSKKSPSKKFFEKIFISSPEFIREDCHGGLFRLGTTSMGIFREFNLGFGSNQSFRKFSCLARSGRHDITGLQYCFYQKTLHFIGGEFFYF